MSIFKCRECNFTFPNELTHLIEQNIQVYCERCGSPFNLEGVKFKPAPTPVKKKIKSFTFLSQKDLPALEKFIQFLNSISFLPLLIFTCISFGLIAEIAISWSNWVDILISRSLPGIISLVTLIYDRVYIYPKVKEKKYNEVFIHSLCWGIVGSILFGLGVIILIKGVLIFFYTIILQKNKDLKAYDYGLLIKDSLNDFSAKAGFLIILLGIYAAYKGRFYIDVIGLNIDIFDFPFFDGILIIYLGVLLIAAACMLIDLRLRSRIAVKKKFEFRDSIVFFILGVFSSVFFAAGIFILLKGVLILFLVLGKPTETIQLKPVEIKTPYTIPSQKISQEPEKIREKKPEIKETISPTLEQSKLTPIPKPEEIKAEVEKTSPKIVKREKKKKEKEFKLQLHDSLLPVKDEKDKKLVQEYFSKIFAVLSKDLRKQIIELKISKKEKKDLLEELAFLTKEEQIKYIETLVHLYKELPKKLTARIRKLPNVKAKHFDKIVEQLKYMDVEEQIQFVQFLEENA